MVAENGMKMVSAILVALAAGMASPAVADLQSGVAKYQAGDYKGALDEWKPLAEQNDANALFNIGQSYRLGRGVAADAKTALDYYVRAANLGHVAAQGNAGTLLYFSEVPIRDRPKAIEWWQKASANGDPRAQYMLGVLHFNGEELPKDWPKAYALTTLARDSGLQEASAAITQMDKYLSDGDRAAAATLATSLRTSGAPTPAAAGVLQASSGQPRADIVAPKASDKPVAVPVTPQPKPVKSPVQTASDPNAAWRVQLGAFSNEATAQREWTSLQARVPNLKTESAFYSPTASGVVRLQTGGFATRTAADSHCAALKSQSLSCFVVKADPK
jgi:uncharacterized protein